MTDLTLTSGPYYVLALAWSSPTLSILSRSLRSLSRKEQGLKP